MARLKVGDRVGVLVPGTALAPGIVTAIDHEDGHPDIVIVETEAGPCERLDHPDYVGPYVNPDVPELIAAWERIEERLKNGA